MQLAAAQASNLSPLTLAGSPKTLVAFWGALNLSPKKISPPDRFPFVYLSLTVLSP